MRRNVIEDLVKWKSSEERKPMVPKGARQVEVEPRYYSDKNREIDFVIQNGMEIIPIEAKGGENKSASSFKGYITEKEPEHAIRFSKRGYMKNGMITNMPLYLAGRMRELL